jgi:hypothetical protein
MNKEITTLISYQPNHRSLEYGKSKIIAEIETGGTDSYGFKGNETIGLAKNEFGTHCLYRGTKDSNLSDRHMVVYFSNDCDNIPELLRELANKIQEAYQP